METRKGGCHAFFFTSAGRSKCASARGIGRVWEHENKARGDNMLRGADRDCKFIIWAPRSCRAGVVASPFHHCRRGKQAQAPGSTSCVASSPPLLVSPPEQLQYASLNDWNQIALISECFPISCGIEYGHWCVKVINFWILISGCVTCLLVVSFNVLNLCILQCMATCICFEPGSLISKWTTKYESVNVSRAVLLMLSTFRLLSFTLISELSLNLIMICKRRNTNT